MCKQHKNNLKPTFWLPVVKLDKDGNPQISVKTIQIDWYKIPYDDMQTRVPIEIAMNYAWN